MQLHENQKNDIIQDLKDGTNISNILDNIESLFNKSIEDSYSSENIERIRVFFLGKNGIITNIMSFMGKLTPEERKSFGILVNSSKNNILDRITENKIKFDKIEKEAKLASEKIDVTLPIRNEIYGSGKHLITKAIEDLTLIALSLGFDLSYAPDLEEDWYNFEALNVPDIHPAKQMQDTFYLEDDLSFSHNGKPFNPTLLRTQTSNVQIRHMSEKGAPCKTLSVGKTYRCDYDATHTPMFHQIELLYIDKDVGMHHMLWYLEELLKQFFELKELPIRLRPSYFPFVEPGVEIDVKCDRSSNSGIKIGQGENWLEILGAGMVHPTVLNNCNIDPNKYMGFAAGAGIERLVMLKYGISDIRKLYDNDIRWLRHYGL